MLAEFLRDEWNSSVPKKMSLELKIGLAVVPILALGFVFRNGYSKEDRTGAVIWTIVLSMLLGYNQDAALGWLFLATIGAIIYSIYIINPIYNDIKLGRRIVKENVPLELLWLSLIVPWAFIGAIVHPKFQTKKNAPVQFFILSWSFILIFLITDYPEPTKVGLSIVAIGAILYIPVQMCIAFVRFSKQVNQTEQVKSDKFVSTDADFNSKFSKTDLSTSQEGQGAKKLQAAEDSFLAEQDPPGLQLTKLERKFESFCEVLKSQFSPDEQTYARYLNSTQTLYENVKSNLERYSTLQASISAINIKDIKKRLKDENLEEGLQVALEKRLQIYQKAQDNMAEILAINEQIMTKIDDLTVSLGLLHTESSQTVEGIEAALSESQLLIDRAEKYNINNY